VGRGLRQVPRAVWAVTALFGALLLAYSLLTPLGEAPDEAAHADLVFHLATGAPYPNYDGRNLGKAVQFGTSAYRPIPGKRVLLAADAPSRSERRDFEEFGGDEQGSTVNSILQHPPLYYRITSLAMRAERFVLPGTDLPPLDREWSLLRLISVAMALPLPLIAWATARRLGAVEPVAIAASLVPLAIPQLLHSGSTITNDVLFNLCAAVLTFFLAGVLRGDRSLRTAAFVGVALGAALLTKAFGTVLVPWVAVAYVVGWRRHRSVRPAVTGLGVAALVAFVVAGWWWLRNVVRYGKLSPTPTDSTLTTALRPPGFEPSVGEWAGKFAPWIVERFWGWLGWFTARLDLPVIVLASAVALVAIVAALVPRRRSGERTHPTPLESAVLLLPLAGLLAFVAVRSFSRYRTTSAFVFIQGRYLLGAVIPFAVVVAAGLHRVSKRWTIAVLGGLAVVMQVDAAHVMLRDWWAEPSAGLGRKLDAVLAWSPWPVGVWWLIIAAVIATGVWAAVETTCSCVRSSPEV
jgi:4-amino-4-deoxy-L-arabinose transferase-like glycosyltransferase